MMFNSDNRLFDELAKAATGAVGALSGLGQQVRGEIRAHVNRLIAEMDFVPRADFAVVESMAREARLQNQALEKRIAALEGKTPKTAAKPRSAAKSAKTLAVKQK